ncbi:MAG TPA: MASE4 domain-containing protein, partial [Caulobacteraceae bacterium]
MTGYDRLSDALLPRAPATPSMRAAAAVTVVVSTLFFLALAPFARERLPALPAFLPAYESGLALCDLLAAALLFAQAARLRTLSLLLLASAYLISGLMIGPHMLTFPGVFSPAGLLGAGPQTAAWIYLVWHFAFPALVIGYAAVGRPDEPPLARPGAMIVLAVAASVALTAATTAVATVWQDRLPVVLVGGDYTRVVATGISPAILLLTVAALAGIALRRRGSVLDLWIMVVLWVWLCDAALSAVVGSNRYDLGWYAGRAFGLLGSGLLLAGLLVELNALYGRLADALLQAEAQNLELIQSREELARAQRLEAVGQLTGGVAHDFNNLLTAIMGALELISRRPEDPSRVVRLAASATKAAERGAQLVRQLLSFARRQSLRPEALDPNAVLTELRELIARAVGETIKVELELDPAARPIRADASELQAALLNLANNARDAMPGGGELRLQTRNLDVGAGQPAVFAALDPGGYVALAVADTGEGMDRATVARAFEPFFTTKPVGKGTGLGLSQVY